MPCRTYTRAYIAQNTEEGIPSVVSVGVVMFESRAGCGWGFRCVCCKALSSHGVTSVRLLVLFFEGRAVVLAALWQSWTFFQNAGMCVCCNSLSFLCLLAVFFPKGDSHAQCLKFSSFVGCCLFMQKVRDLKG